MHLRDTIVRIKQNLAAALAGNKDGRLSFAAAIGKEMEAGVDRLVLYIYHLPMTRASDSYYDGGQSTVENSTRL